MMNQSPRFNLSYKVRMTWRDFDVEFKPDHTDALDIDDFDFPDPTPNAEEVLCAAAGMLELFPEESA